MIRLLKSFVKIIIYFIARLPERVQYLIGDFLGWLWFDVFRIRRQVVLDNLRLAFPDWTEKQRLRVGRRSCFNMGRNFMEYFRMPFLELQKSKLRIEGEDILKTALAEKKGVCLLTLHLGNGDLALAYLALAGYPVYLISKEFKFRWLNETWFNVRRKMGAHFIPPRNSSYAILKALKRKAIVIFVQDQFTGPPIGARTTFFGHETGSALGLSLIAERSGAVVVPVYNFRESDGTLVICFEAPMEFERGEDRDESLRRMTQKYNDKLQEFVTRHPDQWMWVHKRWKKYKY